MFSLKQVILIVIGVMLLSAVATGFAIKFWLFPKPFTPVVLDTKEEQQLEHKINRLEIFTDAAPPAGQDTSQRHILKKGQNENLSSQNVRSTASWLITQIWLKSWPLIFPRI